MADTNKVCSYEYGTYAIFCFHLNQDVYVPSQTIRRMQANFKVDPFFYPSSLAFGNILPLLIPILSLFSTNR